MSFVSTVPVPDSYEAYLYRITVNSTGKLYLGWHKGKADGTYLHSCKTKEFQKDFAKGDNLYEVIDYGTCEEMATKEYFMLSEVDAKNNDGYYNSSNGGGIYVKKTKYKSVIQLYQDIKNKKFDTVFVEKESLKDIKRFQVRVGNTDAEHLKVLIDAMKDKHGDLSDWEPVIVLRGYGKNGEDILTDGNHTVIGANTVHHVIEVPVIYIEKDVWSQFNEIELITLANLLNPQPEKKAKPADKDDWIQLLVRKYNETQVSIDSQENVDLLRSSNWSTRQVNDIIKKAKKEVEDSKMLPPGYQLINWKLKHKQKELHEMIDAANDKDTLAYHSSSANFDIDQMMDKLDAIIDGKLNKTHIIVYVTHPSMKSRSDWIEIWKSKVTKRIERYIKPLGFYVNIIECDYMEKHTLDDI